MRIDLDDLDPLVFQKFPVWFFPMDENDTTVESLAPGAPIPYDSVLLVATDFKDATGAESSGYIYWGVPEEVEVLKPTLFLGSQVLYFWHGIREPGQAELEAFRAVLFPVSFVTKDSHGLSVIKGKLEGVYFYDQSFKKKCIVP